MVELDYIRAHKRWFPEGGWGGCFCPIAETQLGVVHLDSRSFEPPMSHAFIAAP